MIRVRVKKEKEGAGAGWYYRRSVARRRKPWRGPRQLLRRNANRNLMLLMNELIALIKANAPLAQGLEAAGIELRRGRGACSCSCGRQSCCFGR